MTALESICRHAEDRGLSFLVAGGHAVIAHGYARTTFDIDLIIRRADGIVWTALLGEMGFALFREGPTFLQFNPPSEHPWPVDLMFVNDGTFAKLAGEAVPFGTEAARTRMVSLLHLVALKCHAIRHGHPGRIVKDMDDLIHLIELNHLDVKETRLGDMLLHQGSAELYENIRKVFDKE